MSAADGSVSFDWADGHHRFRLAIGELDELQEKCNAGPMEVITRLRGVTWRTYDIRETIRLGLIGGGTEPSAALAIVRRYVEGRPWMESRQPALLILMAAVIGVPGDPVGKPATEGAASEAPATGALSSLTISEAAPPSASPRPRSGRARSGNSPPPSTATTEPARSSRKSRIRPTQPSSTP